MSEDIPKQELLAKLLKMTTSDNDGEALSAIRKANTLLKTAGWDWDKLLAGKIRVAADPFANLGNPYNPGVNRDAPPPAPTFRQPPRPQPSPPPGRPQPAPPPQPKPQPAKPFEPWSHRSTQGQTNLYPGNCYCCGYSVSAKDGKLINPHDFNPSATDKKYPICKSCDSNRNIYIDRRPAPQPKTPPSAPGLNDL